MDNTFKKSERLCSQLVIDKLFAGGNASMAAFPLRIVYMKQSIGAEVGCVDVPPVSVLISVPKKRFRHAVDRNRMKRLIREAYRTNKHILWEMLKDKDYRIVLAFVCITDKMPSYAMVRKSVSKALTRISESLG
ncbi:MAG: ribonuclease P protein component [Bacteroidaceae bacterium]|nr:ribonuclease P protein component [Bacteroidaceae bacterium]MDO5481694.1 ribonuclease P protein component [Bacteroidaceae bacterium]